MGPTLGPPESCRPQMGPMLAPWTLLSGLVNGIWTVTLSKQGSNGRRCKDLWSNILKNTHLCEILMSKCVQITARKTLRYVKTYVWDMSKRIHLASVYCTQARLLIIIPVASWTRMYTWYIWLHTVLDNCVLVCVVVSQWSQNYTFSRQPLLVF